MTNFEANNSSASATASANRSWDWLSDRLPQEGLEILDHWLEVELGQLEAHMAHMITPRSLKRDLRHEFAQSKR